MNWKTKWLSASMPSCTARAALALFAVLASSMLRRCSSSASLASMRYAVCLPKQRMQSGGPAQNAQSSSEFFAILEWRERDSQTSCEKVDIEPINEWMDEWMHFSVLHSYPLDFRWSIPFPHTTPHEAAIPCVHGPPYFPSPARCLWHWLAPWALQQLPGSMHSATAKESGTDFWCVGDI